MQSNDQMANSHGESLKKMETQLTQIFNALVKNKGKPSSTDEHINVLEVVELGVEEVIEEETIPNQDKILDTSSEENVKSMVEVTYNEDERSGIDFPIKLSDLGSFVIEVTIENSPRMGVVLDMGAIINMLPLEGGETSGRDWKLLLGRSFRATAGMVVDIRSRDISFSCGGKSVNFKGVNEMEIGNQDCVKERQECELEEEEVITITFEEIGELEKDNTKLKLEVYLLKAENGILKNDFLTLNKSL
ncbi:hypothetical protein LWI28_023655 [Acer negundo]|uniref:Uncharacterized protein n=1 Tax=Acer negundo TaxID=4023 RepID=A0AAD5IGW0_ACENE|nr:hypothetical protein LWI28_023655 [Acer negundo]